MCESAEISFQSAIVDLLRCAADRPLTPLGRSLPRAEGGIVKPVKQSRSAPMRDASANILSQLAGASRSPQPPRRLAQQRARRSPPGNPAARAAMQQERREQAAKSQRTMKPRPGDRNHPGSGIGADGGTRTRTLG